MKITSFFLLSTLILFLNCAPATKRLVIAPEINSYPTICSIINKNNERLQNLKGRGRLVLESSGRSYTLGAKIILKRPDTLFLKLEAIFGMDVGWLFVDRRFYTLFLPTQNIYYRGSIDSLAISSFWDFNFQYDQLYNSFLGTPLLINLKNMQFSRRDNLIFIDGISDFGRHSYTIDGKKGIVIESKVRDEDDQVFLEEKYERFKRIGGVYIPQTIRIRRPLEKQGLTLFYEEVKINSKLTQRDYKRIMPLSAQQGI